ncbi:MAG TPA: DUF134 domain-containing protein [Synergistaceae bacterium]|nr:DUF134 domain-containing protein [Synergistaceae bacterium]HPJ26311.1 DUF134 domain-containing protein [Synergistaceae bacterium]HPQ37406.1 DUF134 domain-containing protein [Synergistaceae bacterium]
MPRPEKNRVIRNLPSSVSFLPEVENPEAQEESVVVLKLDELEAIRLADLEGLYQQHAAEHMHVSRQTFGNILNEARKKIAECLILGKGLHIEGGNVVVETRRFHCNRCRHSWGENIGSAKPQECPECHSQEIQQRASGDSSYRGGRRKRGFRQQEGPSSSAE